MIIDCALHQNGCRQNVGPVPVEEAAARHVEGGFVWLGMFEPGPDELERARACFGLHELAVEDAQTFHMRPKVESYDGQVSGDGNEVQLAPGLRGGLVRGVRSARGCGPTVPAG